MIDYFALFNLPKLFALDVNVLEERFTQMQKTLHPDNFAGKDLLMRRAGMSKSATVNAAYLTLKDPIKRAHYLLAQYGKTVDDADTVRDVTLLEEQMAYFAAIDTAHEAGNDNALQQVISELQQKYTGAAKRFDTVLTESNTDIEAAVGILQRMQFYVRLLARAGAAPL